MAWAQPPGGGTGCLAIALHDAAYSVVLCHLILDHAMRSGEAVSQGQPIATVGPPGAVGNNGTAHVHLELHRGSQGNNPVAFGGPGGLPLAGADLPVSGAANEHMARILGAGASAPQPSRDEASAPTASSLPVSSEPVSGPAASAQSAGGPALGVLAAPAPPVVSPRVAPAAPVPDPRTTQAVAPEPPTPRVVAPAEPAQQAAAVRRPGPAVAARAAVVEGTGACLKVRDQPTQDGAVVDCVWDGAEVQLGDGVQHSDALTWRQVPGLGWVAEQFLRRTRAVISSTGSCLNVRDTPSTLGAVLTCLPEGTPVTLGESTAGEFGAWTHVTRGDQAGWVLEGFLS